MEEYTIEVTGMSCKSCERIVSDALTRLEGVSLVDADAEANQVSVQGDPRTRSRANQAIEETGYTVQP